MADTKELNDKQKRFALEYIVDLNITQAAIRAGYSHKTAGSQGFELLKKPEIQQLIEVYKREREQATKIDAQWVLTKAAECFEVNSKIIPDRDGNDTMTNASAAAKFLELVGRHVSVKAFDNKDQDVTPQAIQIEIVNPHGSN